MIQRLFFRIAKLHATSLGRYAHKVLAQLIGCFCGFFTIHTEFCQMQILSVVCFFHTVNNRSSFYGNTAGVLAYKRIGCQKLDFHREVQADRLTLRPYFCHIQIPVFFFHFCAFWNLFFIRSTPSRDAECKGIRLFGIALAGHGNMAVPREFGSDGCFYFFSFHCSTHVQVDKQGCVVFRVCVRCN